MVIRYSNPILEQLSEIEDCIKNVEELMERMGIDCDREHIIRTLLAEKFGVPLGQ